jgi:hypothetical protein
VLVWRNQINALFLFMKFKTVSFHTTFPVAQYGINDKVGFEIELESWETPEVALDKAMKLAKDWHKAANPHLYTETAPINQNNLPTIQEKPQRPKEQIPGIIYDIQNCTDKKILEQYTLIVKNKPQLQQAFDEQMKKLTDGQQ